jgi:hypothetical protein
LFGEREENRFRPSAIGQRQKPGSVVIYAQLVYVDTALGGIELRIAPSARADARTDNPRATPEC